ncbi:hypothetical protein [Streptomyces sp. NPDC002133]|uniref:hypothetical protein n=1 Tax=Streptomyces sp. NPDC002133 TaxID=3154409 RepID=UPI003333B09F
MSRRLITERPAQACSIVAQLPQRLAARTPLPAELDSVPVMRTRTLHDSAAPELERLRVENEALHEILEEAGREQRVRADEIRDLKYELRKAEDNETLLIAEYDEQYRELHASEPSCRRCGTRWWNWVPARPRTPPPSCRTTNRSRSRNFSTASPTCPGCTSPAPAR